MTDEIKQKIVDVHNELRNKVALGEVDNYGPAANMASMEWDDTLAKFAEMNVHKCEMAHDECMNTGNEISNSDTYPGFLSIYSFFYSSQFIRGILSGWTESSDVSNSTRSTGHERS